MAEEVDKVLTEEMKKITNEQVAELEPKAEEILVKMSELYEKYALTPFQQMLMLEAYTRSLLVTIAKMSENEEMVASDGKQEQPTSG
jgi:flagellar biosynthesis component FlhA